MPSVKLFVVSVDISPVSDGVQFLDINLESHNKSFVGALWCFCVLSGHFLTERANAKKCVSMPLFKSSLHYVGSMLQLGLAIWPKLVSR